MWLEWKRHFIHWSAWTRFYKIYLKIQRRCNNPKDNNYQKYWARWIKCKWKSFIKFKKDMFESYEDHCWKYWEKDTTIDRIDNNWDYCKDNCKWSTLIEQANNKRNIKKYEWKWDMLSISQIIRLEWLNIDCKTVRQRMHRWMDLYHALYWNDI